MVNSKMPFLAKQHFRGIIIPKAVPIAGDEEIRISRGINKMV